MHTRVTVTINQVIDRIPQLPTSAEILPKLRAILRDPDVNPDDITENIQHDPGLAAQVLRIANSAYYGATQKVKTPAAAVNRIGFYKVYELVGMIVSRHILAEPLPIYHMNPGQLWRISVCCAYMMQTLSKLVGIDQDIAYTIGLMHASGKAAINHFIMQEDIRAYTTSIRAVTPEEELDIFGFTNAQIAQKLLRQWNFREEISFPISCQYNPDVCPEDFRSTTILLYLCSAAALKLETDPEKLEEHEGPLEYLAEVALTNDDILKAATKSMGIVDNFVTKSRQSTAN